MPAKQIAQKFGMLGLILLSLGCRSQAGITVSAEQSLVMEASVLAAGIRASTPDLSKRDGKTQAAASLYNEQHQPVTLYYRFYWYDEKGLEIQPIEQTRSLVIPADSSRQVFSIAADPDASKVRLFLSVRSDMS